MITLNDTASQLLLVAVVALPLLGALAALLVPGRRPPAADGPEPAATAAAAPPPAGGGDRAVLGLGVAVTGAVLLGALVLAAAFDHDDPAAMQAESDVAWIPALGIRLHFGVDGISLPLLVMTALLTFLCALYGYAKPPAGPAPRAFVALLLVLETGTLATFAVLDLMLFFLAFEMVLIPMYFLIAHWGGAGRAAAAWKFILYTLLGSVVMLLGLLLIGVQGGTFDMVALAEANGDGLTRSTQLLAVLAIGIGFAVKTPMWPLHSWLPDAHTAAPTVGSVLLAGVLLKMGTYGLVRIAVPVAPEGMHHFAPYLGAFAAAGIVYGSLACLALVREGAGGDLKRLIAYSSVGHMGFVLLGIATLSAAGIQAALIGNLAHGVITGLLFFLAGAVKDRAGTGDLGRLGGLRETSPLLAGLLGFAAVASLGLPGLAGFWGELFAVLASITRGGALWATLGAVAAAGAALTAGYFLRLLRRVSHGPAVPATAAPAPLTRAEVATWAPLVVLALALGVAPVLALGVAYDPVAALAAVVRP